MISPDVLQDVFISKKDNSPGEVQNDRMRASWVNVVHFSQRSILRFVGELFSASVGGPVSFAPHRTVWRWAFLRRPLSLLKLHLLKTRVIFPQISPSELSSIAGNRWSVTKQESRDHHIRLTWQRGFAKRPGPFFAACKTEALWGWTFSLEPKKKKINIILLGVVVVIGTRRNAFRYERRKTENPCKPFQHCAMGNSSLRKAHGHAIAIRASARDLRGLVSVSVSHNLIYILKEDADW